MDVKTAIKTLLNGAREVNATAELEFVLGSDDKIAAIKARVTANVNNDKDKG